MNLQQMQQMMKQAQEMQERLQQQTVEGNAGGGMVTVVMNVAKHVQSIAIEPEAVSKDDVGMLQDLIIAALNDAYRKAEEEMQKSLGGMMGGLGSLK